MIHADAFHTAAALATPRLPWIVGVSKLVYAVGIFTHDSARIGDADNDLSDLETKWVESEAPCCGWWLAEPTDVPGVPRSLVVGGKGWLKLMLSLLFVYSCGRKRYLLGGAARKYPPIGVSCMSFLFNTMLYHLHW